MTKPTYSELLQDPRWLEKRNAVVERYGSQCYQCRRTDQRVHVHHRYYVSKRPPWAYPDCCYIVLCEECHEWYHDNPYKLESWELFMETCFAAANAVCAERDGDEQDVFEQIAALILAFKPEGPRTEKAPDDERGWMLEFNPRGGHPFHITKPEDVVRKYLRDTFAQKDGDWRPVAFNLTHREAGELADNIRLFWKERGMKDDAVL